MDEAEEEHAVRLDLAARDTPPGRHHKPQGRHRHKGGVLFKLTQQDDPTFI